MAEDDAYIAAFNEKFRGEFVKRVNVEDFIVAFGTLTSTDEETIKAKCETKGNTLAATCLCEKIVRKQSWTNNILKALRSDDIRLNDLANRMEEEFKAIESSFRNINLSPSSSSHGNASNLNVNQNMQLPQTPQGTQPRPKDNTQLQVFHGYTSPTSADSAVFGGSRLATNFSNMSPAFPEKDMNIIPLKKNEEQLVADALDGKQKNVLIVVPNADETRSRIPAHICTTHLQNRGEDSVKNPKAVCLTTTNRMSWLTNLQKYMPKTIKVESILDDPKNITAESIKSNDVILTTAEIFERALTSDVLIISDISLLILDECHFSRQTEHAYYSIIKSYTTDPALTQVVGLLNSSNIQDQEDMNATEDSLSDLMYTLDAMLISTVQEGQIYPEKVARSTVFERRQDDPFHGVITKIMLEIEQQLQFDIKSLERHSHHYGCHIEEIQNREKGNEAGRSILLEHLAIYNKALQMNEVMRAKDAFALLKKFYKEHDKDNEWLEDLYQEHSSELHKLSKEGDSKNENPRLARLKSEILKRREGDFKAIIVSENRQVREALYDWLKSSELKTKSLSITVKSSEIESFNAERRLLLVSSTELKDTKLTGVKMAVIFRSVMDGIDIFQSDDDVTQELLRLVADLQFNQVVKRFQDLPESVKRKNLQKKKLQLFSEVKEQNISKTNLSENVRSDGLEVVKDVTDKSYSLDTNVRGKTSEGVTSPKTSCVNNKSKVFIEKEKCSSVNASGKEIEKGSTKHIPSKSFKVDVNASSQGKKVENQSRLSKFELYCRGGTGDEKCKVFVCLLSSIRLLCQSNHVYNEFYWNWSKIDVKDHHDEKKKKYKTKKIYCKSCGADWGNTFKRYPNLKLKNFLVTLPNGEQKAFSQWKSLGVSIPPMEDQ